MSIESAFIFLTNLGLNFFIHMTRGRHIAANMLDGKDPIPYADYLKYRKIHDILMKSKERCDMLIEETDLPYENASRYIDCMLDECALMIKFYLSKPVNVNDICYIVDYREAVDKDDYNKLFLPEVAPEDRQEMIDFQNKSDERLDMMYAHILVYNELGL